MIVQRAITEAKLMSTDAKSKDETDPAEGDGWISIPEAARIIGITPSTVRSMALKKELEHTVVAGIVFISRDSAQKAAAVA